MSFMSFLKNLFHKSTPAPQPVPVAPVQTAPQPAQNAPVVVPATPVATTLPSPAPAAYNGPFRDINGNPDPKGQYTAVDWGRAHDEAATYAAQVYKGPVPVSSLTGQDKAFLLNAAENYGLPQGVWFAVCSGPRADIDAAIAFADDHRGQYDMNQRRDVVAGAVDSFSKGQIKPEY